MLRSEIVRVHVPESSDGVVEIGGQKYRRVKHPLSLCRVADMLTTVCPGAFYLANSTPTAVTKVSHPTSCCVAICKPASAIQW